MPLLVVEKHLLVNLICSTWAALHSRIKFNISLMDSLLVKHPVYICVLFDNIRKPLNVPQWGNCIVATTKYKKQLYNII